MQENESGCRRQIDGEILSHIWESTGKIKSEWRRPGKGDYCLYISVTVFIHHMFLMLHLCCSGLKLLCRKSLLRCVTTSVFTHHRHRLVSCLTVWLRFECNTLVWWSVKVTLNKERKLDRKKEIWDSVNTSIWFSRMMGDTPLRGSFKG